MHAVADAPTISFGDGVAAVTAVGAMGLASLATSEASSTALIASSFAMSLDLALRLMNRNYSSSVQVVNATRPVAWVPAAAVKSSQDLLPTLPIFHTGRLGHSSCSNHCMML